jgi:hypothetical protein
VFYDLTLNRTPPPFRHVQPVTEKAKKFFAQAVGSRCEIFLLRFVQLSFPESFTGLNNCLREIQQLLPSIHLDVSFWILVVQDPGSRN